jgi:MFS family permease
VTHEAKALQTWHRSVIVMFALIGPPSMALLVRLPEIKELLGVSTSELGLLLFSGAVGSILALSLAARIISRFGTRPQMLGGFYLVALGLIGQAFAATTDSVALFAVCIFVTGFGFGIVDVPLNVDGASIEGKRGRSVLPRLHAAFSVGALSGAAIGTLCIALSVDILTQMIILCSTQMLLPIIVRRFVPQHTGQEEHHKNAEVEKPEKINLFKDKRIMFLGIGILCITLAEGAAVDWLALTIVKDFGESATNAGIAFAIFNLTMTITRFFGGNISDRFGRRNTLQAMAIIGAIGVLKMIFGTSVIFAWIGAALWGIGSALGFPLFISEAGEGENATRRVALITVFGYMAFLVGPPTLGLVAEFTGLRAMLYLIAGALLSAVFFAKVMTNTKNVKAAS